MYDVVERFGSSKITFVIETKKPKKKIVGKKYGKHVENNSMGKVWKHFGKKQGGKNMEKMWK